jgi:predicted O-methyltransferase YrrM
MHPNGVYFAIDPYPPGRFGFSAPQFIAQRTAHSSDRGELVWLRTTGVEAANDPRVREEPIDFLFIDGDHSWEGLRGDWEAWSALISSTGIVALHDSRSTLQRRIDDAGSVRFTNQVVRNDRRFRILEEVDSLSIFERCP